MLKEPPNKVPGRTVAPQYGCQGHSGAGPGRFIKIPASGYPPSGFFPHLPVTFYDEIEIYQDAWSGQ